MGCSLMGWFLWTKSWEVIKEKEDTLEKITAKQQDRSRTASAAPVAPDTWIKPAIFHLIEGETGKGYYIRLCLIRKPK